MTSWREALPSGRESLASGREPATSARESVLLRGASATAATPYRQAPVPAPRSAPAAPPPAAAAPPAAPPATAATQAPAPFVERRTSSFRRASDAPVPNGRGVLRLGEVYAEEMARLREQARREGYDAGFAEGSRAAAVVVAEAEAAAEQRLAEVRTRWERRLVSATAALGAASARLEEAALPVAEDVRESILGAAMTLVEDILGRELALAGTPALDAVRRALALCPDDAPTVVRLHPDDLAEIPAASLAALPAPVTVVGDDRVERAGAVAESGPRRVDAQIGAALERVRAVLAP